jgi:hypothetical protein
MGHAQCDFVALEEVLRALEFQHCDRLLRALAHGGFQRGVLLGTLALRVGGVGVGLGAAPLPEDAGQARRADEVQGQDDGRQGGLAPAPAPGLLGQTHGPGSDGFAAQEALEFGGHVQRRGVTTRWFLAQAFEADRFQVARQGRIQLPRRRRFMV